MKSFTLVSRKNPMLEKCPSCSADGALHRSHSRNWKEKLIKKTTFLKIYRCKKCGWRGYRWTAVITIKSIQTLLLYIGIAIIVALIVRIILSRIAS